MVLVVSPLFFSASFDDFDCREQLIDLILFRLAVWAALEVEHVHKTRTLVAVTVFSTAAQGESKILRELARVLEANIPRIVSDVVEELVASAHLPPFAQCKLGTACGTGSWKAIWYR